MSAVTLPRPLLLLALVALVALLAGCASYTPPPQASTPPRTRCLANPQETGGLRPLFFLFCVESP